jgi:hypothetical protein
LRAALGSHFQLQKDLNDRVIYPVDDCSPEVFQSFITYLYTGICLHLPLPPSSHLISPTTYFAGECDLQLSHLSDLVILVGKLCVDEMIEELATFICQAEVSKALFEDLK